MYSVDCNRCKDDIYYLGITVCRRLYVYKTKSWLTKTLIIAVKSTIYIYRFRKHNLVQISSQESLLYSNLRFKDFVFRLPKKHSNHQVLETFGRPKESFNFADKT